MQPGFRTQPSCARQHESVLAGTCPPPPVSRVSGGVAQRLRQGAGKASLSGDGWWPRSIAWDLSVSSGCSGLLPASGPWPQAASAAGRTQGPACIWGQAVCLRWRRRRGHGEGELTSAAFAGVRGPRAEQAFPKCSNC